MKARIMKVTVRTDELRDIESLEKKHNARFVRAEFFPGDAIAMAEMIPVSSTEFLIDVWNCQASLVVEENRKEVFLYEDAFEDPALFQELVEQVVYEDNNGAINLSGRYCPLSERSVELFKALMATKKREKEKEKDEG